MSLWIYDDSQFNRRHKRKFMSLFRHILILTLSHRGREFDVEA